MGILRAILCFPVKEQIEWAFSVPFCVSLLNLFPTFVVDQLETAFASQKLSQDSPAALLLCGYLLFFFTWEQITLPLSTTLLAFKSYIWVMTS